MTAHPPGRPWTVTVPAELRFLTVIRVALGVALDDIGGDAECGQDLQLATDELASVLILAARCPAQLHLGVRIDDDDVYVRMLVKTPGVGCRPKVADLTRMLPDTTVDCYDLSVVEDELLGVLQRCRGRHDQP